jgi:hypothetical protein
MVNGVQGHTCKYSAVRVLKWASHSSRRAWMSDHGDIAIPVSNSLARNSKSKEFSGVLSQTGSLFILKSTVLWVATLCRSG